MRLDFNKNKRGSIQDILYVITVIGVIGLVLFFFSNVFYQMYSEIEDYMEETPAYNNTEAHEAITDIRVAETNIWDYAFLGIVLSYILMIGIFCFTQQTNPVFYWISVILSVLGLFIGVVLGSVWQDLATQPDLADTVARFPIMNTLLGSYYPTLATFIAILSLVLLYGKPVGGGIGR